MLGACFKVTGPTRGTRLRATLPAPWMPASASWPSDTPHATLFAWTPSIANCVIRLICGSEQCTCYVADVADTWAVATRAMPPCVINISQDMLQTAVRISSEKGIVSTVELHDERNIHHLHIVPVWRIQRFGTKRMHGLMLQVVPNMHQTHLPVALDHIFSSAKPPAWSNVLMFDAPLRAFSARATNDQASTPGSNSRSSMSAMSDPAFSLSPLSQSPIRTDTEPIQAAAVEPIQSPPSPLESVIHALESAIDSPQRPAEPIQAAAVDPIQAAAVDPIQTAAVDPIQAATVEPIQAAAVEPIQAAAVEPIQAAAVEQPPSESRLPPPVIPSWCVFCNEITSIV